MRLTDIAILVALLVSAGCSSSSNQDSTSKGETKPGKSKPGPTTGQANQRKQPPVPVQTNLRFTNVTAQSSIRFTYRSGADANACTMLETLGGGIAFIDYDGDSRLDIFAPGGGRLTDAKVAGLPSGLFRNLGNGKFADVTERAGLNSLGHYTHGAIAADYNNDGFVDILVTGYGGVALFTNNGDGTFSESSSAAAIRDRSWSSSAAWGDINGDGLLDLYIAHYVDWSFAKHPVCNARLQGTLAGGSSQRDVCSPKQFTGLRDSLFINRGDGTFRDDSAKLGRSTGKGIGALMADLDLDGDTDIYVTNDTNANFLWRNDKTQLKEVGKLSGAAYGTDGNEDGSMGIGLGDLNGDGIPDICVSNFQNENYAMYRGSGGGRFVYVSGAVGLKQVGNRYVGWGMSFGDFDQDGDEDLIATNGHVLKYPDEAPRKQLAFLFENRDQGRLVNVARGAGPYFGQPHEGRGLALGDLDGDGDLDVAISDVVEGLTILRNDSRKVGKWLGIRLIGRASSRDAIGTIVRVKLSGKTLVRQLYSGGSYASTSSNVLHFGLGGDGNPGAIAIRWPSGKWQTVVKPKVGQVTTVIERD